MPFYVKPSRYEESSKRNTVFDVKYSEYKKKKGPLIRPFGESSWHLRAAEAF